MTKFTIDVSKLPDPKAKLGQDVEQPGDGSLDFEDAVAKTGQGWFHYKLQLICGLGLMATLVEMLSTGYALPAAQCDLEISTADKGIINAVCYVGMLFGSHLWGFLADTRGRRMVLMLTLLMDCVCTLVAAFAHAVWLLLVARFFNGFFICGSAAVLFAYLGEFHSDATRARAIVWLGIFVAFATILLPGECHESSAWQDCVALPWIEFRSWRLFLLVCALPGLTSALLIRWLLPRSPKFSLLIGDQGEALDTLRDIYSANTGNSPDSYPVKAVRLGLAARRGSRLGPTPDPGTLKARKSAFALLGNMYIYCHGNVNDY
ncbi:Uncharacterized protein GBIM_12715 [Gryllus bimaculatus]|nr:Uncharacterized protein GBIM_12715 [Gryllus bimaculatus]